MTDNEKFFLCIRNWLTLFLPKQRCLSKNSIKAYKVTLNLMIDFLRTEKKLSIGNIGFDTFNRDLIYEFLNWLSTTRNSSISTQNSRLMALRSFFHYAGMMDISCVSVEQEIKKSNFEKKSRQSCGFSIGKSAPSAFGNAGY